LMIAVRWYLALRAHALRQQWFLTGSCRACLGRGDGKVARGREQPAQTTAVTTVLKGMDGAGPALHGQSVVPPRGPTLGTRRLGVLPAVADPSGAAQSLQDRVDRARL